MPLLDFCSSLYRKRGGISASSFVTGLTYTAGRNGYIYKPPGYDDNLNNYPLIFFLHGDGARSTDVTDLLNGSNDVSNEGAGYFLNQGDKPPGVLMALPQIPSGDFTTTDFDNALSFMTTHYRINTNRVYVTGLSRGAFGCRVWAQGRATQLAGTVVCAGNSGTGWNWSGTTEDGQSDIAHFWINGDLNDTTVPNGQIGLLAQANDPTFNKNVPFDTLTIWGQGHSGSVWSTQCYNRKERTDSAGTASFDYVRYLKRFSKDQTERCTLHVSNAEETLEINDWRLARVQVDAMTGATKSSLLTRLSAVKVSIDNGGKRYIIDQGTAALANTGHTLYYANNQTTHTTGAAISNLVDDENGSSSIGFTIVSQMASSGREGSIASSRNRGRYFGFERVQNTDGLTLSTTVTGGTCKFTGLNNAKLYNIRIFHCTASSFTTQAQIRVTIGGVKKTQYSECNTTLFVEYKNLIPSSGEIVMAIRTDVDKNLFLTAFELYQQP